MSDIKEANRKRYYKRGEMTGGTIPPPTSTDALPGSRAKLKVMTERVAAGFHPHHPDDARDSAKRSGLPVGETLLYDDEDTLEWRTRPRTRGRKRTHATTTV